MGQSDWEIRQATVDGTRCWGIYLDGVLQQTRPSLCSAKLWGLFNGKGWLPVAAS